MSRFFALFSVLLVSALSFASPSTAFAADGDVLASGAWAKKTQSISGTWRIVERDGGRFIEFDDQFRTRNAPDLKVFLSPTPIGALENGNALDGSLLIAPLQSNRGAQSYRIPDGVNLSAYSSLIIHCEAYTKLWGGASL